MRNISHKNKKAKLTKIRTSVSILRNVMFLVTYQINYVMLGLKTMIFNILCHHFRLNKRYSIYQIHLLHTFSLVIKMNFTFSLSSENT